MAAPFSLKPYRMADTLQRFLAAPDGAEKVMAHAQLLLRLGEIYRNVAPSHLAQASSVANFKSGMLVIHAQSGAVAAKLRQLAPTLAGELTHRGIDCRGLQIRVHAVQPPAPARNPQREPLTAGSRERLAALRESLPASPLREAVEHLLARSANGHDCRDTPDDESHDRFP
ncbi:MAG TPA: DciA family protein, partial [Candidatus Accumulibacter phosphatis]|nr:DciA family protein [Candidatus Accumulibacter phosphatis]